MSAHVLLNLLNKLGNRDQMRGLPILFVLLLYVPSQQLRSWRDGQFT